ncbi:hypothetical protein PVL29_025617 [Vitis rotundifolia]|uniref:Uncharacterized protein n=1 Tax=Vitis rotundifolia TaxID=103349 RepID=A0AA38YKB6_VITRO|nr:hypothetical protein PVL29_025617 [Vitis rotundifolia]
MHTLEPSWTSFRGKFQKLKILDLQQLEQLKSIIMEEGTLPCLQKLIISHCSHSPPNAAAARYARTICDQAEEKWRLIAPFGSPYSVYSFI